MDKEKIILHCDLNNFYASVESLDHPEYAGLPIAVAGDPKKRTGIILAKNTIAKEMGIKTGDVIWKAKQICPNLICLKPNHNKYHKFSEIVRQVYLKYTDLVEPFGIDECWLDITNSTKLFGSKLEIAQKIKDEIKEKTGLTISIGISFSKMFAKLGSKLGKNDSISVITKNDYQQKVWPLPVEKLIFVGRRRMATLKKLNINTIGDLAKANEKILSFHFGISGPYLKQIANGTEPDEVTNYYNKKEIKSVGNSTTSIIDINSLDQTKQLIYFLSEKVATRLRELNLAGSCISLSIKDDDLETVSHSTTISSPTNNTNTIAQVSVELLKKCWDFKTAKKKIRAVRVKCSTLIDYNETNSQLDFFTDFKKIEKQHKKDETIDKIRKKYGYSKIKNALLMEAKHININDENEDF